MQGQPNRSLRSKNPAYHSYRGPDSTCTKRGRKHIKCFDCELERCWFDKSKKEIKFSDVILGKLAFYMAGDFNYTGIPKFLKRKTI